ncbi:RNA editing associated helicase 2 [Perkinsela sp. CCAP 1560/4]|nr:RNA editing associated helicase 2 [Perkinsela sp. CCAP 1560/4]|eukprot:KNH09476.1 RNA editing associated helicase 2 [Perkinsela sp. CCAP 1560/4]
MGPRRHLNWRYQAHIASLCYSRILPIKSTCNSFGLRNHSDLEQVASFKPINADERALRIFKETELFENCAKLSTMKAITSLDHFSRLRVINYSKQLVGKDFKSPTTIECLLTQSEGDEKLFLSGFMLPLDKNGRQVLAYGISVSSKESEICAFMHAENLLIAMNIPVYHDSARQKQYNLDRYKQGRITTDPEKPRLERLSHSSPGIVYRKQHEKADATPNTKKGNDNLRKVASSIYRTKTDFNLSMSPDRVLPCAIETSLTLHHNPENLLKNVFLSDNKELDLIKEFEPVAGTTAWTAYVGFTRKGEKNAETKWVINVRSKTKSSAIRYAAMETVKKLYICVYKEHEEFFRYYLKQININDIAINKASPFPKSRTQEILRSSSLTQQRAGPKKQELDVKSMYKGEVNYICRSTASQESQYHIEQPEVLNMMCRARIDVWYKLRKQGKQLADMIEYYKCAEGGLNNSNIFQAEIVLPLPEAIFGKRVAIGIAHKKKDASLAAVQHAELILDAVGVPIMPAWPYYHDRTSFSQRTSYSLQHPQDIRASKTRAVNRWAPGTRDHIRPNEPSPPPLSVKPDEVIDGAKINHFTSVSELGECQRSKVSSILIKMNAEYSIFCEHMVFSKLVMHVAKIKIFLPSQYGGEKLAQGLARSNAKAVHLAFVNAYQILDSFGVIQNSPRPSAEVPPPLLLMDTNVDCAQQGSAKIDDYRDPPEAVQIKKLLRADTKDGFILVKEQAHEKNEIIHNAIADPRITDPHCIVRTRAFYRALTKNIHSELPVQIDEFRGGNVYFRRGTMTLKLPSPFPTISICGEARTKKEVQILCSMHLELQLDAMGYPVQNTKATQFMHAMAARAGGRNAPLDIQVSSPEADYCVVPPLRKDYGEEVNAVMTQATVLDANQSSDANIRYGSAKGSPNLQIFPSGLFDLKARGFADSVEDYLSRYKQTLKENQEASYRDNQFIITCKVPMPEGTPEQQAVGAARIKKEAEQLCHLHFALVLKRFKVRLFVSNREQEAHEQYLSSLSKHFHATQSGGLSIGVPKKPEKPLIEHYDRNNYSSWEDFCKACDTFVVDMKNYLDRITSFTGPSSGDALIDEARMASEKQELDNHSRTILYNFCSRVGLPYPQTKVVATNVNDMPTFLATMKLRGYDWIGTGTGSSNKNAEARAAMHCVEVLRRTHPEFDPEQDLSSKIKQRNEASDMSAWMGKTITNIGYERIAEMYALCNDLAPTKMSTAYTGNGCRATISLEEEDGARYEGVAEYGTRVIAEQMAREALCIRMKNLPKFVALVDLFRQHPKLDPDNVFSLDGINKIPEVNSLCNVLEELEGVQPDSLVEADKALQVYAFDSGFATKEEIGEPDDATNKKKSTLPIFAYKNEILEKISSNSVFVLSGTTGCGKTTQIPQYILEHNAGKGVSTHILVTQPRRISAISVARRVAEERGQSVGMAIGYSVRFDHRIGKKVNFISIGILLRILTSNPMLNGISHVIVDEVHERDINTDYVLLILRKLVSRRSDLRVIVMSATLQSDSFSKYFGGVPIVHVDHPIFPVREYFLEDIAEIAQKSKDESIQQRGKFVEHRLRAIADRTQQDIEKPEVQIRSSHQLIDYKILSFLVQHCVEDHEMVSRGGTILVFLPGWHEIQQTREELEMSRNVSTYSIVVLHSAISAQDQMQCFVPAPIGMVKIILATNIAESGITIDDVVCVIDTGKVKEKQMIYQSDGKKASTMTTLLTVNASQANCMQRKGRAGRTREGFCYRLFSKHDYAEFKAFRKPEILRLPLESLCLSILDQKLGTPSVVLRQALDSPDQSQIEFAMESLKSVGAVFASGALTPLGKQIARMPVSPSSAKMLIIGCRLKCLDLALTIAASMDVNVFKVSQDSGIGDLSISKDILSEGELSDCSCVINAYTKYSELWNDEEKKQKFIEENNLHEPALQTMSKVKRQLFEELMVMGFIEQGKVVEQFREQVPALRNFNADEGMLGRSQKWALLRHLRKDNAPFLDSSIYSHQSYSSTLMRGLASVMFYPNVAMRMVNDLYRTKIDDTLRISSRSVVRLKSSKYSPFVVFGEKVAKSTFARGLKVNGELRNVTHVGVWTLLLFGASAEQFHYREDLGLCIVDDWLIFKLSLNSYEKILQAKRAFEISLEQDNPLAERNHKRLVSVLSQALRKICEQDTVCRLAITRDRANQREIKKN